MMPDGKFLKQSKKAKRLKLDGIICAEIPNLQNTYVFKNCSSFINRSPNQQMVNQTNLADLLDLMKCKHLKSKFLLQICTNNRMITRAITD